MSQFGFHIELKYINYGGQVRQDWLAPVIDSIRRMVKVTPKVQRA